MKNKQCTSPNRSRSKYANIIPTSTLHISNNQNLESKNYLPTHFIVTKPQPHSVLPFHPLYLLPLFFPLPPFLTPSQSPLFPYSLPLTRNTTPYTASIPTPPLNRQQPPLNSTTNKSPPFAPSPPFSFPSHRSPLLNLSYHPLEKFILIFSSQASKRKQMH